MNILVAIDLSKSSEIIIGKMKELTKALSAKIWLLHVAEPNPDFVGYEVDTDVMRDVIAKRFQKEHSQLQEYSQELRSAGLDCTALLVQGPTTETILNEAAKLSAGMVILGSQGKGVLGQILLGSTSEGVLHKSPVPVLVVPTHGMP
jgi:nucleotide-binding universal stress UspA family protein